MIIRLHCTNTHWPILTGIGPHYQSNIPRKESIGPGINIKSRPSIAITRETQLG